MIPVAINSGGEGLIAAGLGGVWLLADEGARLVQIDPGTNTVVRSSPMPSKSFGIVTGFGSLWVTQLEAGTVTRVNPKSLQAEATFATGLNPLFLAAGGGAVWVINQGDGTVSRLEPSEDRISATVDLDVAGIGGCISADTEAVWVTVPGIPLTRIDMIDSRVTHQFRGPGGDCLSLGFDSVWLSNHEQGTVARIRLRA
jgi:virginiamycin B lyase